jgi:hypothetical protein
MPGITIGHRLERGGDPMAQSSDYGPKPLTHMEALLLTGSLSVLGLTILAILAV